MEETRVCKKCNTEYPVEDFKFIHDRWRGYECGACRRARNRAYYANNPVKFKTKTQKRQMAGLVCCVTHGMTPSEHDDLFVKQDGRCAICDIDQCELNYPLYIDHDHSGGHVRGLLCNKCNYMLGFARDNPEILRLAADYLERY